MRCAYLLLFVPCALSAQTAATVEGTINDAVTHRPVAGVAVTLWTQKGVRYNASSDTSGVFRLTDVQPGDYNSRYEKTGFQQIEMPRFGESPLRVGIGGSHRIDVELMKLATLRGRVLDRDGNPAEGAVVTAGLLAEAASDREGRFTLTDLRPGTYIIRAVLRNERSQSGKAQTLPTYFPSAIDESAADRVVVRGGADLAGFDIHLRTSPVFRIRGTVLDENGKPAAAATVKLLKPSRPRLLSGMERMGGSESYLNLGGPMAEGMSIATDDNGRFEFPTVRPGDWQLQAELDARHDAANQMYFLTTTTVPAPLSDHDLDNVNLRFESGFPLAVTPDWGDAAPPAGVRPGSVRLLRVDSGDLPLIGRISTDSVNNAGVTRFPHVAPGQYRVIPGLGGPAGFYAAAVLLDGRDVSGQDAPLTASSMLRILYKPNPGKVRGTIEHGEGATVLLWPQGAGIPYLVPTTKAGPNGFFEFNNLPPGTYSLLAFDHVNQQNVSSDYVLQSVAAAPQVKVQELGDASVTLPLTHWPD